MTASSTQVISERRLQQQQQPRVPPPMWTRESPTATREKGRASERESIDMARSVGDHQTRAAGLIAAGPFIQLRNCSGIRAETASARAQRLLR